MSQRNHRQLDHKESYYLYDPQDEIQSQEAEEKNHTAQEPAVHLSHLQCQLIQKQYPHLFYEEYQKLLQHVL